MAWYRLYRPKKVQDLSISSVRESLSAMMKTGKLPQTLLFAGPKGTGKTSASRILGAMLNDPANAVLVDHLFFQKRAPKNLAFTEPDETSDFARRVYEGHSFVVQELDAASNRRIDDIRLLRERINLPPSEGKMMVYILDEVHMLTSEAFNALLKILEEPPAHVVFILATTELHKIPATIVSRCSLINFRKANIKEITEALTRVLKAEQIKFKDEDLEQIAWRADGSFRDGVKILEMACKTGKLDLTSIKDLLASNNEIYIKNLLESVIKKDAKRLSSIFEELRSNNYNQRDFYKDFLMFLHQDLMRNLGVIGETAVYSLQIAQFFLKEVTSLDLNQDTPIPFLILELKLLEIIERSNKKSHFEQTDNVLSSGSVFTEPTESKLSQPKSIKQPAQTTKKKIHQSNLDKITFWQKLVETFATNNFSLLTLLKSCKIESLGEEVVQVSVYYPFHKEQLEQNKNKELLAQAAKNLLGSDVKFDFVLQSQTAPVTQLVQESDLMLAAKDSLL